MDIRHIAWYNGNGGKWLIANWEWDEFLIKPSAKRFALSTDWENIWSSFIIVGSGENSMFFTKSDCFPFGNQEHFGATPIEFALVWHCTISGLFCVQIIRGRWVRVSLNKLYLFGPDGFSAIRIKPKLVFWNKRDSSSWNIRPHSN